MVCHTFATQFGLWNIMGEASSTLQPCWLKIPYGVTHNTMKKVSTHTATPQDFKEVLEQLAERSLNVRTRRNRFVRRPG